MFRILTTVVTTAIFSVAMAQESAKPATINDHSKALETCRSLNIKGVSCKKLADQCHTEKDVAACITEKSKEAKK